MAADAHAQLAETLERIAHATGRQGPLSDALVKGLPDRTAGPTDVVVRMLNGGRLGSPGTGSDHGENGA